MSAFSGFFNPQAFGMAGTDPFAQGNDLGVPEGFNKDAVGLAGVNPMGNNAPRPSGTPTPRPPVGLAGMGTMNFADGGSVPGAISEEDELGPMGNSFGAQMDRDIRGALNVVNRVLNFGRKSNGLPEVQYEEKAQEQPDEAIETAGVIPSQPFSETPKPQPMPGPMPPTSNPFGKRVEAEEEAAPEGEASPGAFDVAGVMPSAPYSETPKPQPMPGPLPPTSNPFGKRVEAEEEMPEQAIDDTEETA